MKVTSTLTSILLLFFTTNSFTQVVVNEFMASNETTVSDQDDEFDDWIELFNGSSMPVDLSGYYLSDNAINLTKWEIPAGTSIDGQGYLIFWADEDQEQEGLHTNFKLAKGGEVIYLINPMGEVVDEVVYGEQMTDLASARQPNGTGDFVIKAATFLLNNDLSTNTKEVSSLLSLDIYPNPTSQFIQIEFSSIDNRAKQLEVFNVLGVRLFQDEILTSYQLDMSKWSRGAYFVRVDGKVIPVHLQ